MFKKVLDSITDKEEKYRAQQLGEKLKVHEEQLQIAIESNVSFLTLTSIEARYQSIAKELNALFEKNGIVEKVQSDHKVELEKVKKSIEYRDQRQATDSTYKPEENTGSPKDTQYSLGAYPGGTPIVSKQRHDVPTFNLEKLQLDSTAGGSVVASTPIPVKSEVLQKTREKVKHIQDKPEESRKIPESKNTVQAEIKETRDTKKQENSEKPQTDFSSSKHCLEYIKQELPNDISPNHVESYLENQENRDSLINTIKQGFRLPDIYEIVKENIRRFIGLQEEELINISRDNTPLFTALDIFEDLNETDNSEVTMPASLDMRGLSVKDALDLIPRYNGANIPLTQFLDGCAEAKSILPEGVESDFMKFIRIRLYGEALNIARSEKFETLKNLSEFFEKMFGSAKTYYDLTGELAKIKQGRSETVVLYLNRLKEIEKEIRKAAEKEGRITNESTFNTELSKDCLKYFMRGLRWEIKARMGTPATYQKAQEEAIETEREFACSIFEDPTEKDKVEEKPKSSKEVRRVNIIEPQLTTFTCWYCNKPGHTMARCFALERNKQAWTSPRNSNPPRNFGPPRPPLNSNAWGWNGGNARRVGFLPDRENHGRGYSPPPNRGNMRPPPNISRPPNRPPLMNGRPGPNNFPRGQNNNMNLAARRNFEPRNAPAITCYYCGRTGHVQRDCFSYRQSEAGRAPMRSGNLPDLSPTSAARETPSPPRSSLPQRENVPRPSGSAR